MVVRKTWFLYLDIPLILPLCKIEIITLVYGNTELGYFRVPGLCAFSVQYLHDCKTVDDMAQPSQNVGLAKRVSKDHSKLPQC